MLRRSNTKLVRVGGKTSGPFYNRKWRTELTPREWEVANLWLSGMHLKRIAGKLNIAYDTVKTHMAHVHKVIGTNHPALVTRRLLALKGTTMSHDDIIYSPEVEKILQEKAGEFINKDYEALFNSLPSSVREAATMLPNMFRSPFAASVIMSASLGMMLNGMLTANEALSEIDSMLEPDLDKRKKLHALFAKEASEGLAMVNAFVVLYPQLMEKLLAIYPVDKGSRPTNNT